MRRLYRLLISCAVGWLGYGATAPQGEVLSKEGAVDFTRTRTNWTPAQIGQKLVVQDRLRTLALSRAMLQMAQLGRLRVNELTTLEVLPPQTDGGKATLDLKTGALYFFTRDKPREFQIQTPHAIAASRGTEFLVTIEPGGRTVFTVFDGQVEVSNPLGNILLDSGEQGAAQAGQPPVKLAVIQAVNIVQWWLYYPGILDLNDLPLTAAEQAALAGPIASYQSGNIVAALDGFPAGRVPQSDAERIFYAGLLLSAGQVDKSEALLNGTATQGSLVSALREVISVVSGRALNRTNEPATASEWLARSYSLQAEYALDQALAAARRASEISTNFGFAWERVAELEFSFRRTGRALAALEKALALSPQNAQAWALKGFLEAAENRHQQAERAFQTAVELDRSLANGWLGLGLMRIRAGDDENGRAYLQTAAAMEPNRSLLRSYLAKAFDNAADVTNATKELRLAKKLDLEDPTPWLYSALLLRQELRFNQAVNDLEQSVAMNENRRVYRSRFLLDEDRAVRSSSLATIYQNAGMNQVSLREAARAVASDYANPSAHLFLAESFNALRDPTRFNLRVETAWFNELLLANLLAPVGGGTLSQHISQQEYSRLFERDRFGLSSFTEARSDHQLREQASQFGTIGSTSYALDLDYQHNDGVRPNNELDRTEWYSTIKQQLTPQDAAMVLIKYQDYHSGDNFQYYNPDAPGTIRTNFNFDEYQKPIAVMAYHHEWAPGNHTLFLGGRLENDQRFSDKDTSQLVFTKSPEGEVVDAASVPFDVQYRSQLEIYTAELNQILNLPKQEFVFGGRYQNGRFKTTDELQLSESVRDNLGSFFGTPPAGLTTQDEFERLSAYVYDTINPFEHFLLTAGIAYDQLTFPRNYREPPITEGSLFRDQFSPKFALVWAPLPELTFRGVYTRALGGVSFDESFRLEPTQLAGFSQSYRTIIPESVAGSVAAPTYETLGGAIDVKLHSQTYLGLQLERLTSELQREIGVFSYNGALPPPPPVLPTTTAQNLDYQETSLSAAVNQLLSTEWSLGAEYRLTRSELQTNLREVSESVSSIARQDQRADLHQVNLLILYNHPSGFFARSESQWYHQSNHGYSPELPGDEFLQQNFWVGYRLRRQRGEISFGILNVGDANYHLNPLNVYSELPRERTFVGRLAFNL